MRMPDLEVEVEVEVEVNLYNVSKDVILSQSEASRSSPRRGC